MAQSPMYSIVSAAEAKQEPYPYVYVNDDQTIRELHPAERQYLETLFSPFDGGRPYIKSNFQARDGWGNLHGFCHRSQLPANCSVANAPAEDPNPPMSRAERIAWMKSKAPHFEVIEMSDGTVVMKRVTKVRGRAFRYVTASLGALFMFVAVFILTALVVGYLPPIFLVAISVGGISTNNVLGLLLGVVAAALSFRATLRQAQAKDTKKARREDSLTR